MKRALGAMPTRRPTSARTHNAYPSAFKAHRGCDVRSMTYAGDRAECEGCGNRWIISRDSRGEPTGYRLLATVNVGALVG